MSTENPEPETDTDIILAEPSNLKLASGLEVKVLRLRTKALLILLRIMMRGASDILFSGKLDPNDKDFQQQLVLAILFSIPEDSEGTLEFLRAMVEPAQLRQTGRITPGDVSWNEDLWNQLDSELEDPDIDDLIDVVVAIVKLEAPHIQALGKKLTGLAKTLGPSLLTSSSEEIEPQKSSKPASKASTRTASSARTRKRTT